jgi:hypothetical protein
MPQTRSSVLSSGFRRKGQLPPDSCGVNQASCCTLNGTSTTVCVLTPNRLSTAQTKVLGTWCAVDRRKRRRAPRLSLVTLRQTSGRRDLIGAFSGVGPERPRDPLCKRSNSPTPSHRGLRKVDGERTHQTAVAVALLEKPCPLQRLSRNPIQQEGINLRSNRLHEIAGEAVAGGSVDVPETEARIEPEGSYREARL